MTSPAQNTLRAFTLIELLVTMALIALLVLGVSQVVDSTASLTGAARQTMDAGSESILVLNRMKADFDGIVLRPDVDYYFRKTPGNDEFAFFSQANGFYPSGVNGITPQSPLALVGYRIKDDSGVLQLERLNKALVWNGVSNSTTGVSGAAANELLPIVFLPNTISAKWPSVVNGGGDADYQSVGSQVFRLEVCFLMKDGTVRSDPPTNLATNGLGDVRSVVVAIAVLDAKARVLVPDQAALSAALTFPDPSNPNALPAEVWNDAINAGSLPLPAKAASQLRVYQRTFPVSTSD